jgi:hypothetical protein
MLTNRDILCSFYNGQNFIREIQKQLREIYTFKKSVSVREIKI